MTKEEILRSFVEKDHYNDYMDDLALDCGVASAYSAMEAYAKQEAISVFRYVHRFSSHSDFVIETLYENYELYKQQINENNK